MGWEYFPTFPLVSVPSYCPPPLGPLTRELSSTKSPLRPLGNLSTIGPETKKTLTPKLPRNSHRTPPCGTLLRCFRALLMPLRMKLNPKVGVFFQPSKNGRGHVFWPNVWTWAPQKKKHVWTDSSWFELKLLKYHCSVALSMFCQVFVEMYRSFLQDDFGSTNWSPNGHYLRTHSKGTTWFWPKLRLEARFLWIWPVAPIVWMWKQALLMGGKRENMDLIFLNGLK